jgi:hypothetical protein
LQDHVHAVTVTTTDTYGYTTQIAFADEAIAEGLKELSKDKETELWIFVPNTIGYSTLKRVLVSKLNIIIFA